MSSDSHRADALGIVGLGVMGSAISNLLVRSGADVWGHDIDPDRMRQLQDVGGHPCDSPADVAARCPVVLTSLPSAAALHDVISGSSGIARGRAGRSGPLVIEMSTLSIADKERGRQALESAGSALVDAPLSGTGSQARSGDLVVFVSADSADDRQCAIEALRRCTRAQYDVGAFGNGTKFKYIANLLVAIHNVAAAEALVLAEQAGLDLSLVLAAIADGAGASRMFEVRGPLMAENRYDDPTVRLEVFLKDVHLITEFAQLHGAPTPLFQASAQTYEAARARGWSDRDTACVAEILRTLVTARDTLPGNEAGGPGGATS